MSSCSAALTDGGRHVDYKCWRCWRLFKFVVLQIIVEQPVSRDHRT